VEIDKWNAFWDFWGFTGAGKFGFYLKLYEYVALDDTLSMELVEAFLGLWLKMEDNHMTILGSGLVILEKWCEYSSCDSYGLTPLQ